MRAVMCRELSGPDGLTVEDIPTPACGAGQVRVAVAASGLNYVDALFTQGRYQIKPPLPFTPGSEIAGVITEVGGDVEGWTVGERVAASVGLGGYSDQVLVGPAQLLRIPDGLSFGQGATMLQSYATAWFTLTRRTQLAPDDQVLVLGAAGGVGLATLDVVAALGARSIAAASSEEKLALCRERGADATVDYSSEDLKARVRELTHGGATVVVDPVGGAMAETALRSLGTYGRFMVIGFASGEIPSLPANQILLRNRQVIGVDWGAWAMANPVENNVMLGEVMDAVESGQIDPIEPITYPMDRAGEALDDLLNRRVTGKACLVA